MRIAEAGKARLNRECVDVFVDSYNENVSVRSCGCQCIWVLRIHTFSKAHVVKFSGLYTFNILYIMSARNNSMPDSFLIKITLLLCITQIY